MMDFYTYTCYNGSTVSLQNTIDGWAVVRVSGTDQELKQYEKFCDGLNAYKRVVFELSQEKIKAEGIEQ